MEFSHLQHYILVKLCAILFLVGALLLVFQWDKRKRFSSWGAPVFLFFMGLCSGLGYYFLVQGTETMFWGLKGDEITIAAMYETFAHGSLLSDFAYRDLPPFYPPLFFWIVAICGRLFSWNGVQMAKWAATSVIIFYPLLFYCIQKWFWSRQKGEHVPGPVSWMLSSIFLFIVISWDAVILKPYELVSASLVVLWTQFFLHWLWDGEKKRFPALLWFGFTGGILFLLFYFWFFLAAIGVTLFHVFYKKVERRQYGTMMLVSILMLLLGSLYAIPLVRSYHQFGSENWQLGFLTPEWLATEAPFFSLTVQGIILLIGLLTLLLYHSHFSMRVLLFLFIASYIWQLMGLVTILFFSSPLQESKGFYFFNRSILALAAAYGLGELWRRYAHVFLPKKKEIALVGILLLSTLIFPGTFVDDPNVYGVRERSLHLHPDMKELVTFLERTYPDIYAKTALQSGLHELHAYLPVNDFVYFNMHNSHPAAQFSERYRFVQELARKPTPQEFYAETQKTPFGPIDLFVFYTGDPAAYPLYFHVDDFPYGFKEEIVNIPKELFDEQYFTPVFSNERYIVFTPKTR
ncbi:MAG TPA: arabinofuranosyltransferase [Candidatus Kapabacteria bacterium]|nr:arabinofuranosyltransferase [Candidatus Kapabacteria bacterium]